MKANKPIVTANMKSLQTDLDVLLTFNMYNGLTRKWLEFTQCQFLFQTLVEQSEKI